MDFELTGAVDREKALGGDRQAVDQKKKPRPRSKSGLCQDAQFRSLFERVGNGRERAIQVFAESLHRGDDHN